MKKVQLESSTIKDLILQSCAYARSTKTLQSFNILLQAWKVESPAKSISTCACGLDP